MTAFPPAPSQRLAVMLAGLLRRVALLEARTAGIDAGTRLQAVTGMVDPAYVSGQPQVTLTGDTTLTGPYQRLASYTPTAGDTVLMVPLGATFIVAGKLI